MDALKVFQTKYISRLLGVFFICLFSISTFAQEDKKVIRKSANLLSEAQQNLQKNKFTAAEAEYRKAISLNPKAETGKYNLGTAYYGKEKKEVMIQADEKIFSYTFRPGEVVSFKWKN